MPSVTVTYAELAARLGRSEDAAKSLAKRKRWKRTTGNDGLARITLEEGELADMSNPDRRGIGRPPANSTWAKGGEPRSNPVHDLQARIAAAEALAVERKRELEAAREKLSAVEGQLRERTSDRDLIAGQLEGLRAAFDEMRRDRDVDRTRASELALEAAAAAPLKVTVEALKAALETEKHRSTELRDDRDSWRNAATAPRGWLGWLKRA